MKINGIEIDMEKAAHAVAAAYALIDSEPNHVPEAGEIDNLLSAYLHAYLEVISKDPAYLRSLVE